MGLGNQGNKRETQATHPGSEGFSSRGERHGDGPHHENQCRKPQHGQRDLHAYENNSPTRQGLNGSKKKCKCGYRNRDRLHWRCGHLRILRSV